MFAGTRSSTTPGSWQKTQAHSWRSWTAIHQSRPLTLGAFPEGADKDVNDGANGDTDDSADGTAEGNEQALGDGSNHIDDIDHEEENDDCVGQAVEIATGEAAGGFHKSFGQLPEGAALCRPEGEGCN